MIKNNLKIWLLSSLVLTSATLAMSSRISIPDFSVEQGKEKSVEVTLDNDGSNPFAYSGWQFDLFVPEGLSVESVSLAKELSDRDFKLSLTDYDTGIYRVLAFTTGTGLSSANLMSISFKVAEDISAGEQTIFVRHVVVSAPDGMDIDLEDSAVKVTVSTKEVPAVPKAETPTQLLRKGDGTSHTFVAMMGKDDAWLEDMGYRYVFGYDNAGDGSVALDVTERRYTHTAGDIYWDPACHFWVFAFYPDADGNIRYSARRYLDGRVDDDFNPEVLVGAPTRGDDAPCAIYTVDGHYVGSNPAALGAGIYIVRSAGSSYKIIRQ